MNHYLAEFLTVALLHLLAVVSPGPDFVMISRSSIVYSRKTGVYSALGLALGILVHITYSLVGIGYIIAKSVLIFSTIKLLGAGYLVYIGIKSLKAQPAKSFEPQLVEKQNITRLAAIRTGFLTNVLNPKVTLFFLAIFTQVIHKDTPLAIKILYGAEMSLMTFTWFAFVSVVLSHQKIKKTFVRVQHYLERTMGVLLIGLGIKVALSKAR